MPLDPDVVAKSYEDLVFKFGRSSVGAAPGDIIWDAGGDYTGYIAAPSTFTAVSSSIDDAVGGGGATRLVVVGQDADGIQIFEEIALNGTTPVTGVKEFSIIYRCWTPDSEDPSPLTGANHGTIDIYETGTPANLMARIVPTAGQTLMCVYRVPMDKYGELRDASFFANEGKGAIIAIKRRKNRTDERGWRAALTVDIFQNEVSQELKDEPRFLYPGTDVVAVSQSAAAGTIISGHYTIRLYNL